MNMEDIRGSLCWWDTRSPTYPKLHNPIDQTRNQEPRELGCECYNCYHKRDRMAVALLEANQKMSDQIETIDRLCGGQD